MIAIVILIFFILLVLMTPWRQLSAPARLWALVACSNALVFFGMPTTPATSPWRPIVGRVLATSAAVSLSLAVLGLVLRRRPTTGPGAHSALLAPLIIGALPAAFYIFFWVIGPLY
jgi:hypothetical protein